jgi:hypothetical protein
MKQQIPSNFTSSVGRVKKEFLYSPVGTLLMEYTIAVGGNVGMGTLIIFGSGLLIVVFPPFPSDCLRLLLTYVRTFCCKSAGNCNTHSSLTLTLKLKLHHPLSRVLL